MAAGAAAIGRGARWASGGDGFRRVARRSQRPLAKKAGKAGQPAALVRTILEKEWESSGLPGWRDWCGKDEVRHKYLTFQDFLSSGRQPAMRPAIF